MNDFDARTPPAGEREASESSGGSPTDTESSKSMSHNDVRALAARLIDDGLYVFPTLHKKGDDNDKKPPPGGHGFHDATNDPDEFEKMLRAVRIGSGWHLGVGVHPGRSGHIVLDPDVKKGGRGLESLAHIESTHGKLPGRYVRSPSGGLHIWMKLPDGYTGTIGNKKVNDWPDVDVRCHNGYVIAPGVTVPWGGWTDEGGDIGEIPKGVLTEIENAFSTPKTLDAEVTPGNRHDSIVSVAASMWARGLTKESVLHAARAFNAEQCKPPKSDSEVVDAVNWAIAQEGGPQPNVNLKLPGPEPARRVRLTSVAGIDPRPVRWLWAQRVPIGEITLTPGYGGVGKSTFHAWMMAQLTRGTLPGEYEGTPRPVIICAREDSWSRTIVPRLIAAGADRNLVYRAEVVSDDDKQLSLTLPADIDGLKAEIQDKGIVLVSIDPLLSVIDKDLDTFKASEVRTALEPLAELADETNGAILGNAHYNKGSASDPILKMANSAAFGEVSRAALVFAEDKEAEQLVISQGKNNLGRLDLPSLTYQIEPAIVPTDEGPSEVGRLVFTGESQRSVRDILSPHQGQDRSERDTARQIILDVLTTGPRKWADVADEIEAAGVSEGTGRRARDELKKAGTITLNVGVWTWEIVRPSSPVPKVRKEPEKPTDLAQPVSKDFTNNDGDLLTLRTLIDDGGGTADQSLRNPPDESDLAQAVCSDCGLSGGRHGHACRQRLSTPEEIAGL